MIIYNNDLESTMRKQFTLKIRRKNIKHFIKCLSFSNLYRSENVENTICYLWLISYFTRPSPSISEIISNVKCLYMFKSDRIFTVAKVRKNKKGKQRCIGSLKFWLDKNQYKN